MKHVLLSILLVTWFLPAYAQDVDTAQEKVNEITLDSEVETLTADDVAEERQQAKEEIAQAAQETKDIQKSYQTTKEKNRELKKDIKKSMNQLDRMQAVTTRAKKDASKLEKEANQNERQKNKLVKHVEQLQKMEDGFKQRISKAQEKKTSIEKDIRDANKRKLEADRTIPRLERELRSMFEQNKRLSKQRSKARVAAATSERKARGLQNRLRRTNTIRVGQN